MAFTFAFASIISTQVFSDVANIADKALVCSACHGPQGNSSNPEWPNLAGQHAHYLQKQLQNFKEGKTRKAGTMTAIVANLSAQDIAELAHYYAKLALNIQNNPNTSVQALRGEQLYRRGDFAKKITACIACHGPKGTGNDQAGFPVIAGQNAKYLILQLQAFKQQQRQNDLNEIMQTISARMSQEDMEAVSYYMQGLH